MAIIWDACKDEYVYDNSEDDGRGNEASFRLALLNEIRKIHRTLDGIEQELEITREARERETQKQAGT